MTQALQGYELLFTGLVVITRPSLVKNWCHIFVTESVRRTVRKLRVCGIGMQYNPDPANPEAANAYFFQDNGVISACAQLRNATDQKLLIPVDANACIRLLEGHTHFNTLERIIRNNLNVI